ncbi:MAG: hypothetical protein HN833_04445 [Elusimicrobiaceae bacterium]|jgi:hypothetical protein|nr:hypothetical protein [Elusimicrobiaceae bacterium]MBT3954904.1 hypothetical protein [Elusimicrobiaceae bacterium]MBT4008356.1 hypothetical protein [Elusimicrobiaceae bacterium]MBT4403433.1 hypothetical protein [Elusimicrobiaceae bacterium]MBT4440455.1 hypothetical protein [Elusimicrobiaceae bacterium]
MKKLIILTTSLMLVSGGINATETLNKLVETRVEQEMVSAPLPIIPAKFILKVVYKSFKEAIESLSKEGTDDIITDALRYSMDSSIDSIDDLLKQSAMENYINKFISFKMKTYNGFVSKRVLTEWLEEALGYAVKKDLQSIGIEIGTFNARELGERVNKVFSIFKGDITSTPKGMQNFWEIIKGNDELGIAMTKYYKIVVIDRRALTLDELAKKVKKAMYKEAPLKLKIAPKV